MKIQDSETIETNDYRVLIYPASRPLLPRESKLLSERLFDFLSQWKAHEKQLSASFKIEKNQFLVVCVDEEKEPASGCSIDALGKLIKSFDEEFSLGFFDRMKVCYQEKGKIKTLSLQEFKTQLKNGYLSDKIEVFDFSKSTYAQFLSGFLLPLEESWASSLYLGKK
ncbi:MAG: hypothetical protein FDW93_03750 [Bergeyella sp.]|nr:hypothetical protein [Bergeyella sp.]